MDKRYNIVIVTQNFANGGTERRATVLANELAENGYRVTYMVLNKIYDDVVYSLSDRIELVCINDFKNGDIALKEKQIAYRWKNKRLKYLRLFHRIAKIFSFDDLKIRTEKNKLGFLTDIRAYSLYNKHATYVCFGLGILETIYLATKGLNNKLVYTEASAPDFKENEAKYQYFKKIWQTALKESDLCVFQTSAQKEYYGTCTQNNGIIIKNPLVAQLPEPFVGVRQKKIVNFCRTHPVKNLEMLVDAFSLFLIDFPDYVLYIYGITCTEISRKYKEEILTRIEGLGLKEKIKFLDAVPNIHDVIVDYDMFISTSDSEGLSNSMIEAMALGLPCICTDCDGGGAREMIQDGENGLIVPVKDVEALYQAMCRMVCEKELSEKCGRNAAKVREFLSVETITGQWIEKLESI